MNGSGDTEVFWIIWLVGAAAGCAGMVTSTLAGESARGQLGLVAAKGPHAAGSVLVWAMLAMTIAAPVYSMHSWLGLLVAVGGLVIAFVTGWIAWQVSPASVKLEHAGRLLFFLEVIAVVMLAWAFKIAHDRFEFGDY